MSLYCKMFPFCFSAKKEKLMQIQYTITFKTDFVGFFVFGKGLRVFYRSTQECNNLICSLQSGLPQLSSPFLNSVLPPWQRVGVLSLENSWKLFSIQSSFLSGWKALWVQWEETQQIVNVQNLLAKVKLNAVVQSRTLHRVSKSVNDRIFVPVR